jgi:hypothetical protein
MDPQPTRRRLGSAACIRLGPQGVQRRTDGAGRPEGCVCARARARIGAPPWYTQLPKELGRLGCRQPLLNPSLFLLFTPPSPSPSSTQHTRVKAGHVTILIRTCRKNCVVSEAPRRRWWPVSAPPRGTCSSRTWVRDDLMGGWVEARTQRLSRTALALGRD